MEQQRTLKISCGTQERGKYQKTWKNTPKLTLQGNWFEKAGFAIGEFVRVIVADNLVQIINDTVAPKAEEPREVAGDELVNNFDSYLDTLHYDGYSNNIRREYPHQWEELLRQYKDDYPRLAQEPEVKLLTPIQLKRKVLSELSATIIPLVASGDYANINEGLIDMYKDEQNQTFKTYNQWKADGFQVRRGAKAFNVWAKPLSAQEENPTPEDEDGRKFFPLCFLFSNTQVEKI